MWRLFVFSDHLREQHAKIFAKASSYAITIENLPEISFA